MADRKLKSKNCYKITEKKHRRTFHNLYNTQTVIQKGCIRRICHEYLSMYVFVYDVYWLDSVMCHQNINTKKFKYTFEIINKKVQTYKTSL